MGANQTPPNEDTPNTARWIQPFGDVFIGLDEAAVIRHVIGVMDKPADSPAPQVRGLSWTSLIEQFAAAEARPGLLHLWAAVAEQRVAPSHYPPAVPFQPGTVAQLRPVENDPVIRYALHLAPAVQCNLDTLIGTHTLKASQHLIQLSRSAFRGVYGPLTDPQVKAFSSIVTLSETMSELLNDLRTEITAPTTMAPLAHPVSELLNFSTHEFTTVRRISTHELGVRSEFPTPARVYCYAGLRHVVHNVIETLLSGLTARAVVTITTPPELPDDTVPVTLTYHTKETALHTDKILKPLDLFAAERFQPLNTLQRLITTLQSHIRPIAGYVWAEPMTSDSAYTTRICLVLPRWQDAATPIPR